ncbi:MAG: XRE family transcriptional regulator [Clostridia bacterium]|jgi:transcriptional regulator with XRE-family HTH domain|nr:helix-turn-helix transcriptional regulator [Lachnospiraceae bacterium]NCC01866.1 XRE family transcriptional regulator [Clostridia bacterium]NCD02434.1 XRE family transcriptional regulator [Clostridia bacterium]
MSAFANRLRELRLKFYWNQSQLARRAGVSTSLISSYEKSERFPSLDVLIKLSDIFCCSTDYLLGLEYDQTITIKDLSDNQIRLIIELISEFKKEQISSLPKKH